MESRQKIFIGQVLLHRGQTKYSPLEFLLDLQSAQRQIGRAKKIGELLVEYRVITPLALTEALVAQEHMPQESITAIIEAMRDFPTKLTKVFAD